jgi:hypothetical protein
VSEPIRITPISDEEAALWRLVREVTGLLDGLPWILIGGLMVRILEAEHGVATTWTTGDLDTVLDVRAVSGAIRQAVTRLQKADFTPERHDENLTYRFIRGSDIVDVLAPDHLGRRADITTVPPDETLEAVGSRQALNGRRIVNIDPGDGPITLPLPSLLGAIIMKARVVSNTAGPMSQSKHRRDLARLLALVPDPVALHGEMRKKEHAYLRERSELLDAGHRAWTNVANAENGIIALEILAEANLTT